MRIKIPNRRASETIEFAHNGFSFSGSVSYSLKADNSYDQPIEIFISGGKAGTEIQSVARDMAVSASLALQHGVSLDVLRNALTRNENGSAAGPLGTLLDILAENKGS